METFLPQLAGTAVGSLTLEQLSQHTSGLPVLPRILTYAAVQSSSRVWTTDEFIDEIRDYKLPFKPGTRAAYSNVGFRLLAAVIEAVERKDFHQVLRERILQPFKLQDTILQRSSEPIEGLARGYGPIPLFLFLGPPRLLPLPNWNYSMLIGAGGLVSTVRDLFLWDRALSRWAAEDPEWATKYFSGGGLYGHGYNYGWGLTPARSGRPLFQSHTGGTPGFFSLIIRVPQTDSVAIVLSNSYWRERPDEGDLHDRLVDLLADPARWERQ